MGTFSSQLLLEKLTKLNTSQQSIETVSQWCQFHRKEAKQIVTTWEAEFSKQGPMVRKLALLYVANDILQNSRKKGPEFVAPFYHPIIRAIKHMLKHGDEKTKGSVLRLLNVMDERRVFGVGGAKTLKELVSAGTAASESTGRGGSKGQGAAAEAVPQATPPERKLPPALVPLADALADCASCDAACSAGGEGVHQALQKEALDTGGPPAQQRARSALNTYAEALEAHAAARSRAATLLRSLLDAQTEVGEQIKQQLLRCRRQQQTFNGRVGQGPPPPGPHLSAPPLPAGPPPSVPHPPLPRAPAPLGTGPAMFPPAGSSGFSPQPPPLPFGAHQGVVPPGLASDFLAPDFLASDFAAPPLPPPPPPTLGFKDSGGFGKANGAHGGPADDVASAAAQMAAQLASDTAAQSALLEALKALPREQRQEITSNMSAAAHADEEYDPEDGLEDDFM